MKKDFRTAVQDFRKILALSALVMAFSFFTGFADAQPDPATLYTVQPGSVIWFDGSSTVNEFTCRNHKVNGFGTISAASRTVSVTGGQRRKSVVNGVFYTEVICMSCGLAPMDHDMYKALKASEYPEIRYTLDKISILPDSSNSDSLFYVEAAGKLSVAGKTNVIDMPVKVTKLGGGRFMIEGSKLLSMHDYGITPPTALWGLIRANDGLTVHFQLIAAPDSGSGPSLNSYEVVAHAATAPH